ncbi:type-F conjugative transfer system protein TraW [Cysteiniphilum marinum]|uniref:type-F conjugative transfer system protein TraW n=1 Tax=Cysteiniphilum marinum TaxID=2774191 RepID=UPI00193B9671|nr:type-F conjugative transfer system protein TraW [Cysteiniphilum marinum]
MNNLFIWAKYPLQLMFILTLCLTLLLPILLTSPTYAKNLGQYGHTFEIVEMNFLDLIHIKLNALEQSGFLAQWQKEVKEKVKAKMLRPTPINLPVTLQPDTFYYQPMITLPKDIVDHTGKILYRKGLTVNALDVSTYPKQLQQYSLTPPIYDTVLLFANGDDALQVKWLAHKINTLKQSKVNFKVILTGGNVHTVSLALKFNVRFDQGGFITRTLGIKAVPSVVSKEDVSMKIEEIDYQMVRLLAKNGDVSKMSEISKISKIGEGGNDEWQ